jgi:DNA polymerase III subunit delta'
VSLLPWLEPLWRQTLAAQRAHALLLAGPAGAGQFELGLALARSWLCESPAADGRACGHCASCTLVAAHTHPDLQVLVPEALAEELGWGDPAEGGTKAGKAKPSKDVKVEALRAAVEFAQQTSSRARAKVVLIHPAERMNAVSANTLLKTLEEPPGLARFVLCTGALDQLLPTIRSRCQLVALPTPARAESLAWLEAQGVDAAEVLLDAAGGVPLAALELHRQGLSAKAWQALPAALAAGQVGAVSGWSVAQVVDALGKCCEDGLRIAAGGAPRYFTPAAWKGLRPRLEPLLAWREDLKRVARHAEHPWQAGLAAESLVSGASRALHCTE